VTECQNCARKSQLFFCAQCAAELREMLSSLDRRTLTNIKTGETKPGPGGLELLEDVALGRTRLGESARRSTEQNSPMPVNLAASEVLGDTHAMLAQWAETINTRVETLGMSAANLAALLARNVNAIAHHDNAGQCFTDIRNTIDTIERAINRPIPPRFLGPCPTLVDAAECNTALTAGRDDREVRCPSCKSTHNVDDLLRRQVDRTRDMSFTIAELYGTIMPAVCEYIPMSTLRHWIVKDKLLPTGYDADGEPRFLLDDVRRLRDQKPQKAPTGAAAKKRAS
jgi:hypothetical protein